MFKRIMSFIILAITIFLFNQLTYSSAYAKNKLVSISSVDNINIQVNQNTKYNLPKTVVTLMSDNTKRTVEVKWNANIIDTSKVGTHVYLGTVKGYKSKVKLTLRIIPYIAFIENQKVTIEHNSQFELPKIINANMSNNEVKSVPVTWDNTVNTSQTGTFDFLGTIKGYNDKAKLTLKIIPKIASITDNSITINTNTKYELPNSVGVLMSDNTIGEVGVQWIPNVISTNTPGKFEFKGKINGYNDLAKLTLNIINIYSNINDINENIKLYEKYTLPEKISATLINGVTTDASIMWNIPIVDTSKVGNINIIGTVIGYDKQIKANFNIYATVSSILDKKIEMTVGDEYQLPQTIQANMSDGTLKQLPITWDSKGLDLKKVGEYDVVGKVNDYSKDIHLYIKINSNFKCLSKNITFTKWGYMAIDFSKNIVIYANPEKITLIDENGVRIGIKSGIPVDTLKTTLLIYPVHDLLKNIKYTLIIPKNTIQAEDGEYYSEEIRLTIQN